MASLVKEEHTSLLSQPARMGPENKVISIQKNTEFPERKYFSMQVQGIILTVMLQAHLNSIFSDYIQFNSVQQNFTEFQTLHEALDVFAIAW